MDITFSVGIPCYNESRTLAKVISAVASQKPLVRQIIVVNNGSTDETVDILEGIQKTWGNPLVELRVIRFQENRGKGAAIQAAVEVSSQPYFLIQDADLELTPLDYPRLVEPIEKRRATVVYGNRFPVGGPSSYFWLSRCANRSLTWLANLLFGLHVKDQACGYKLLPTEMARELQLTASGFEICSEITAKLGRRHVVIESVPVHYQPRSVKDGKKRRWVDGAVAVYTLLKYGLRP